MALPNFFHAELDKTHSELELSQKESSHASLSRRLHVGDEVKVFNGNGGVAKATILELNRNKTIVQINQFKTHQPPSKKVHIASAIPKGDRIKIMIDMLTQLGVFSFTPLICEYSNAKIKQAQIEKWQKIVIESCKQSHRPFLMQLESPIYFKDCLNKANLVCLDASGQAINKLTINTAADVALMIGPEGGFSNFERQQIDDNQIAKLSLAESILRVETAAIVGAGQLGSALIDDLE